LNFKRHKQANERDGQGCSGARAYARGTARTWVPPGRVCCSARAEADATAPADEA